MNRPFICGKKYEHNIFPVKYISLVTGKCKKSEHKRCNLDYKII